MGTEIIQYDRDNKQEPYTYMARILKTRKIAIGNVVVEKPWYSSESAWKYYIEYNNYGSGGFCGGCTDLGLTKVEVDKDTIVPFNQFAKVKLNQEIGIDTELHGKSLPGFYDKMIIRATELIPDDLYKKDSDPVIVARFEKYGTQKDAVIEKPKLVESIIQERLDRERNELYAKLLNFWNESKDKYKRIVVGLDMCKLDCEEIGETEEGKFDHTLSCRMYDNFEDCLLDFVKEIDPTDICGFDYGEMRNPGLCF